MEVEFSLPYPPQGSPGPSPHWRAAAAETGVDVAKAVPSSHAGASGESEPSRGPGRLAFLRGGALGLATGALPFAARELSPGPARENWPPAVFGTLSQNTASTGTCL